MVDWDDEDWRAARIVTKAIAEQVRSASRETMTPAQYARQIAAVQRRERAVREFLMPERESASWEIE